MKDNLLSGLSKPRDSRLTCKIQQISETLSEEDRNIFRAAVDDPDWPASTLSKALKQRGIKVADVTIARHRSGQCNCNL
jgi:hypothetical protein